MESDRQPANPPIINITGQKVALGPLSTGLLPLFEKWLNDIEGGYTYVSGPLLPKSREAVAVQLDRLAKDETCVAFAIYECATLRPIGFSTLFRIDHFNRICQFSIRIGERDCWHKGYGTEATFLTVDYGFNVLGVNSIMLTVFGFNERAVRIYERVGFRPAGRWRGAKRLGHRVTDIIFMDCLATEFRRCGAPDDRSPG